MINLASKTVMVTDLTQKITGWAVWFRVPTGLLTSLDDAIAWCESHDMNPDLMIVPVPVAITEYSYEAVSR